MHFLEETHIRLISYKKIVTTIYYRPQKQIMTVIFPNKSTVLATPETLATNPSNSCSISKIKNTAYKNYSPNELRDAVLGWVFQ